MESIEADESLLSRTFHLTIAYDGSRYAGWQVQPGRLTVQGELERVVESLVGGSLVGGPIASGRSRVLGSGRTDAGVHAMGQVARLVLPRWNASSDALLRAINSKLPDDIVVRQARPTWNRFHPIADALTKTYRYQMFISDSREPFLGRYAQRISGPLDVEAMRQAAGRLLGCHDFAAFQTSGAPRQSTVRTLLRCDWESVEASGMAPRRLNFVVTGNGFLYNMVRNLVGTMLEVGRGRRPPEWIDEVLASKDRRRAGPTAAARGLFLMEVTYPDEVFLMV